MRKDSVTAQAIQTSGMALKAKKTFLSNMGRGMYSSVTLDRIKCLEGYIVAAVKRVEWGMLDKWAIVDEARRQLRIEYARPDSMRLKFK